MAWSAAARKAAAAARARKALGSGTMSRTEATRKNTYVNLMAHLDSIRRIHHFQAKTFGAGKRSAFTRNRMAEVRSLVKSLKYLKKRGYATPIDKKTAYGKIGHSIQEQMVGPLLKTRARSTGGLAVRGQTYVYPKYRGASPHRSERYGPMF